MAGYTYELEAVLNRAEPLARVFKSAGHRFFLVGGVVRDYFLGRFDAGQDLDATTDARPDAIRALVAESADEVWSQGERFGTIGCVIAGQSYEITTHRAESYVPESRKPSVVFGDDIVDDLARRDFTVNAMAIDMADRSLVDPFGGEADLASGVLRTPLEPEVSLSEDPLRMLRAARFCASCALSPATELVAAMAAERDRLEIVSVERIRDELQKLLLLDDPTAGLELIDATGVGRKVPVIGILVSSDSAAAESAAAESAAAESESAEAESTGGEVAGSWESAASRLRELPPDAAMRWAALLSSLGVDSDGRIDAVDLRALKFSGELARAVSWLLREGPGLAAGDLAALADRRFRELARGCPAGRTVEDLLTFVAGLRSGDGLLVDDVAQASERLVDLRGREPDLDDPAPLFSGSEVAEMLGVEPGPELGKAMNWLVELRVAEGPLAADAAAARLQHWWSDRTCE